MRNFDDDIQQIDVENALHNADLRFKRGGTRYILSQCPLHEDKHESAQIFTDDWFVNCMAGCGRYHITKAFPELRRSDGRQQATRAYRTSKTFNSDHAVSDHYKTFDLMEEWRNMPLIPRDHVFKTIPLEILDELGWRWAPERSAYFIPYFNRPKTTIPFAQYRNLLGDVRFNFLKDAKPTMYGTWNLEPGEKIILVEGTSDAAALDFCAIPWIAAPSASSGTLVDAMMKWCGDNRVTVVYGGDNDAAGDKLLERVKSSGVPYRIKQPPKQYKDWCEFLAATDSDTVSDYCMAEIGGREDRDIQRFVRKAQEIYPGTKRINLKTS